MDWFEPVPFDSVATGAKESELENTEPSLVPPLPTSRPEDCCSETPSRFESTRLSREPEESVRPPVEFDDWSPVEFDWLPDESDCPLDELD
ncbi:hypothetical protein OOZ19_14765 [Saccharopolyspora sp. NFXS83]|uniref:hypothetical protein n=1 Tax=Saccharopolyspora sp. NFXS83 TaxID=2993560 RepID=UPI00224A9955|nr:hypothetical protein [Saccharopolyspora sp. NFXS83]MCX2731505.1 hypothetical protein [Saccharopolyspora sp. NFXS83]